MKKTYLGLWLPRFESQTFRKSALNLCYLRLCIQNSLEPICLDDSKSSPRLSTHKDNLNRLLTPLVLNKIQQLNNEYLYSTLEWLGNLYKSSPKILNKIWKNKYFSITIKLVFSERYTESKEISLNMSQYMLLFLNKKQKETSEEKLSKKLTLKPHPQNPVL